jgi:hypothetical protein
VGLSHTSRFGVPGTITFWFEDACRRAGAPSGDRRDRRQEIADFAAAAGV